MGQPEQAAQHRQIQETFQYLGMLLRRESYGHWLWDKNQLQRKYPLTELYKDLQQAAAACTSLSALYTTFREFKQKHFLRIGGRDCLGLAGLAETMSQIADLAAVCLQVGLEALASQPDWWTAKEEDFDLKTCPVAILGLGKLGGGELNYVSDIDLIYLSEGGENCAGQRKLLQTLTGLLSDQVNGDHVFKVDLRLRPQGKDGDLVPSLEAAVNHYLVKGRAWERQALLKARTAAGNRGLGATFLKEIRPFVFRRFLDFQSLDELREMRDRLLNQAKQESGQKRFDVKLGLGGIREIEFIVQSFQLIYGGRYRELDEANTLRCLNKLEKLGLMPEDVRQDLEQGYCFLRRVEHWIQLDANRQSHRIPASEGGLQRLIRYLGFGQGIQAFEATLSHHCAQVSSHFEALFSRTKPSRFKRERAAVTSGKPSQGEKSAQEKGIFDQEAFQGLPKNVVDLFAQELQNLAAVDTGRLYRQAWSRLERFAARIRTRPGLCRQLESLPPWLPDLCRGVLRSQLIADLINHQPGLMEGLPEKVEDGAFSSWRKRAESILAGSSDFEQSLEWIRRLKNERLLAVALAEMNQALGVDQAAAELSSLADFILRQTFEQVCLEVLGRREAPIAVLALGKLGSSELTYLSDLDLMYVFEPASGEDQDRIPASVIKCIQRFMRLLSTPLQEGPGYEVDSRLRPTGNYGPLAVSRKRWESYYAGEADIWEVQSLLRVRHVAGNRALGAGLVVYAQELCAAPRASEVVWQRLCGLRSRMEQERGRESGQIINLKLGYGGLADLEFLVQGDRLIADLTGEETGQVRLLESLDIPLQALGFSRERKNRIKKIGAVYQALEHSCQIFHKQGTGNLHSDLFQELQCLRTRCEQGDDLLNTSWEDILGMRREVRSVWNTVCC